MRFRFLLLVFSIGLFANNSCGKLTSEGSEKNHKLQFNHVVPARGNSWVVNNLDKNSQLIGDEGIINWKDSSIKIRTYFKVQHTGNLNIGLITKTTGGEATIKVSCGKESKEVTITNSAYDTISVGVFYADTPGSQWVELQGIQKSAVSFPDVESVLIGGEAASGTVYYVNDDFYWGRRGPSVHLNFEVPENSTGVEWFYNEITVPENNDVLGSYFMANGFGQGYFGMQVNSPTERRILFSVWSLYKTDNPGEIPEDYKIKLLKKGDGVYTGEFGNEGSGGQSYLKFPWKAGTTYKFLLRGKPTGNGETDFTAWFFAPEVAQWKLIASFRRPKTETYLTRLYSFLENFMTKTGCITRKGYYSNQWIYTTENQWTELTRIKFTADATARKESRMDYSGGVENGIFFLRNCGFFSDTTPIDSYFERQATGIQPIVDFDALP